MKKLIFILCLLTSQLLAQSEIAHYNVVWNSQSVNSSESMPLGGGDIGVNVWVEKGDIYLYLAKSGAFDENNTLLKLGRVKVSLSPNPFEGKTFKQELVLKDGYIQINGANQQLKADVKLWVDVFKPVVSVEVIANQKISTKVAYQSWRYQDRITKGKENNQNSYKWAPQGNTITHRDSISYTGNQIEFYHQNQVQTVFDVTVKQQGLDTYKSQLYNPLSSLIFGGVLRGQNMKVGPRSEGTYLGTAYQEWSLITTKPSSKAIATIQLLAENTDLKSWKSKASQNLTPNFNATQQWWNQFWNRSFIVIDSKDAEANQIARNYNLFRYQLGANAYSKWPTKFNGGLFTYDPILTDTAQKWTPDYRSWGGGTHTAQNQRLVYWPMLKSGDVNIMKPQFDFYLRLLKTAELRSKVYWNHGGASFTEQMENFGLPNPAEYSFKRPADFDKGVEYNAWLEYEWDTVLEFCQMMLETQTYAGQDVDQYIPFVQSCLDFFKEHYTYLAKQRSIKGVDQNGHLVLFPGSGAETYKMAYNSTSTIAGLQTVLKTLLSLPSTSSQQKESWNAMLKMIPPMNFRTIDGHTTIAPAKTWERVNNVETPQLYPVYPWGIYGLGKSGLDTAINTYKYDPDGLKFRSAIGWKQDNIWSARLGLIDEAVRLNKEKLKDSERRFPTFWGPGFDWTPDHNWGGSGMIGLQEMLLQTNGKQLLLFPAWPKTWDVHFKLHAPEQTTIEATLKNGKITELKITPESRKKDVVNMLERN